MAYEVGSSLSVANVLHLTPLKLAAKLARIEMFFHILNIEREIYWQIGSITCAAYPLSQIDTIDVDTGQIVKNSALNLVVFGDKDEHLELMDGVLIDLLNAKWNTFVKSRFYRQFYLFCCYFLLSAVSFVLRPGPDEEPQQTSSNDTASSSTEPAMDDQPLEVTLSSLLVKNLADQLASSLKLSELEAINASGSSSNDSMLLEQITSLVAANLSEAIKDLWLRQNSTTMTATSSGTELMFNDAAAAAASGNSTRDFYDDSSSSSLDSNGSLIWKRAKQQDDKDDWWDHLTSGECRLMNVDEPIAKARIIAEIATEIGAILYILAALREARFLGLSMFVENLMTAPSRVMFLISCSILLSFPFLRFDCADELEDMLAVVVMLTTAPYFLFFCRGFKSVGPFVVMIYRMIMGDLLRFVSIYLVFVMGFSQAYYIIFLSFDNPVTPEGVDDTKANPMPSAMESIMAMFLMSMTNFGDYYDAFENTEHEMEAKSLFVVYMAIVAILLVNMLIAMMGNTYQKIAETRNEWQRQWARIVLVVERGVAPAERLKKLNDYSQPMSDGRKALVLRLSQSEEDKEEMKEILEMKRVHERMVKRRKDKLQVEKELAEKKKQQIKDAKA